MPTLDHLILQGQPIVGYFVRKWAPRLNSPSHRDQMESDAYLALFKAAQRYKPERGGFFGYASQCVNGACIDCLREVNRSRRKYQVRFSPLEHAHDAAAQDDGQRMIEVKDLAQHCLQMLKGKQTETVRRYFFDGKTMDEVGREMGVTKANVAAHVKKARRRVRERMGVN